MVKVRKKLGFTISELLICLGILAVLIAIAVPIVTGVMEKTYEKSDKLNAKLYTSYMTKYANEEPKPASSYTNLDATEHDVVYYAGNSYFPGALQGGGYYSTDEEVWAAIRREAIVAMKMYGEDVDILDNYLIKQPKDLKKSYIYYYLKGTIEVEDIKAVKRRTAENITAGNDSIDNYWVCLDKVAGNADAVTASTTGDIFVKIFHYGLGKRMPVGFIEGCNNHSDIYLQSKITGQKYFLSNLATENFHNNNILQFSNVPKGQYQLYIYGDNITDLPSSEYASLGSQTTSGIITVSDSGNFAGNSLSNAYPAYLLAVTRGSVSVHYKDVVYNTNGFVSDSTHEFGQDFRLDFYHGEYQASYSSSNYIKNLYDTVNSLYLPFETYSLKFTSPGYNEFNSRVVSTLHGIYDEGFPNDSDTDFVYDIIARKTTVNISGTIDFKTGSMPIANSIPADDVKYIKDTYAEELNTTVLDTKVLFVARDGSATYTLNASDLTFIGNGKYTYNLDNVVWSGDGTYYDVFFYNTMHGRNVELSKAPIFVEGFNVTADYETNSYFKDFNLKINKQATSYNDVTQIRENVRLVDMYDSSRTYTLANDTLTTVRGGFYYVYVTYPSPYNVTNDRLILFVQSTDLNLLLNRTFSAVTITGSLTPKDGTTTISGSGDFYKIISLSGSFTDVNGDKTNIDKSKYSISKNSTAATYTVTLPLAPTYGFILSVPDDKCYDGNTTSTTVSSPVTSKSHSINVNRKSSKSESNHRGTMKHGVIDYNSHSVTCNFCTKQLNNHTGYKEVVTKKGSCTAGGTYNNVCTVSGCSHVNSSGSFGARNHSFGSWYNTTNPTCYSTGAKRRNCQNTSATSRYNACNHYETGTVSKTAHSYSSSFTIVTKGTCSANGYKEKRCSSYSKCGAATSGTTIPARGHSYGSYWTVTAATCTTAGVSKKQCQRSSNSEYNACSYIYTNNSYPAKLGHDKTYKSGIRNSYATCNNAATFFYTCTRCGEKGGTYSSGSALGHAKWWTYDGKDGDDGPKTGKHWQKCTRSGCSWTSKKEAHTNYWAGSMFNAFGQTITVNGSSKKCLFQYCSKCGYDP